MCLAFADKEWKALLKRLGEHKITIRGPFILGGSRGTGTSIFVTDPEGFTIELKTYDND